MTPTLTRFIINNTDDLYLVQDALALHVPGAVAVEDARGKEWLLVEDDNGDLYMHGGDEDGYTDADFLVRHYAPFLVLSDRMNTALAAWTR